jgi:protein TonB
VTPPPATEATADALADLVYRPHVAAPDWEPSRQSVALVLSLCAYAGIGLLVALLLASQAAAPITPPKVAGTVTLFEAADPLPPAPRPVPATHAAAPELPVAALPAAPLREPSFETPAALPTAPQAAAAPAVAASAGKGQASPSATAPRFDAAYLNNPDPAYPAASRRIGEEGRVILRVLVSAEGRADQVEICASSGSSRLDQAALAAVKRWRFEPARQSGAAIAAWVLVPISFHLDA